LELNQRTNKGNYLVALHSSSETFGVAIHNLKENSKNTKNLTFKTGRDLSKNLFSYIDQLLPYREWNQIARIAVATGPGGFTGTRLSIAMARTIAQQLKCPLDGISSFSLMAIRLYKENIFNELNKPFWIISSLKRRGLVGGKYTIQNQSSIPYCNKVLELKKPYLLPKDIDIAPFIKANDNVFEDTLELLKISISSHLINKKSFWGNVLPIYPTSPVDNIS
tara:strand:+ start:633 stop:1298 length:666 start_codon:yes stop_codon:yes gene_type:complete